MGLPTRYWNDTSLETVDIYNSEDGDDTQNGCLQYMTYESETFKGCSGLKRVTVHDVIYMVAAGSERDFQGVTNCHVWFLKTTALTDWTGDGFVNRWMSYIRNSRVEFSHTNVSHFPLRGTKIVWSDNDNDWVEVPDDTVVD